MPTGLNVKREIVMKKQRITKLIAMLTMVFILLMMLASCADLQWLQGPQGPQGEQGIPGADGEDGKDGIDGSCDCETCEHSYVLYFVLESTCSSHKLLLTCEYCRDVISSDEDPTVEHTYEAIVTPPTCTEGGYTTYTCGECGDSYVGDFTDALGHNFVNGVCTRCGLQNASQGLEFKLNFDEQSYSVTEIGTCTDTDIIIPATYKGLPVTAIADSAFRDCSSLTSVVIPDSVTRIGDQAFYYCKSLTSVVIPDSVTSIGPHSFESCSNLTSVVIPDSVTSIDFYAFVSCTSLTSVEIPDSVTSIGDYAFSGCTSLTSVLIPDSVTSIGERAFFYCSSLKDVYYTGSAEDWAKISIYNVGNSSLTDATKIYNYAP